MKRLLFLEFLILIFSSCSDLLEGVSSDEKFEAINGFNVEWRNQITPQQKNVIREILNNMILVEGGYFTMGATPEQSEFARNNEYPNIYVKLSDFYIGKYEISDEQFNIITGFDICASENYASRIPLKDWNLFITVLTDLCSINFSLPTEAQWEYAARGGNKTQNYIFPGSNNLSEVHSDSFKEGSNKPNELGIYNMADLKSEWCADLYDNFESTGVETDRLNNTGKYHVVRGGNFLCSIESSVYYPTGSSSSYSSTTYYNIGHGLKVSNRDLDYRHCRTTSRSYAHDNEIGADYIGCRLVVNTKDISK